MSRMINLIFNRKYKALHLTEAIQQLLLGSFYWLAKHMSDA